MAVEDTVVERLIAEALVKNGWTESGGLDPLEKAFRSLQARRQAPGNSLDLNLAAAEHYMFARWVVGTGEVSVTQMKVMIVGYDAKKLYDRVAGNPDKERVTANPVSKPDGDVVLWGLAGAEQGALDMKRFPPASKPPLWRSVDEVLGGGGGGYRAKSY